MEIEPIDRDFEAEAEYLIGSLRKRESAVDFMHRVVRIRELLRLERNVRRALVGEAAP